MSVAATTTFKHVVRPSLQAVVSIYTVGKVRKEETGSSPRSFNFGPFRFQIPGGDEESAPQPRRALGSGVIVREDGLVITNNHVVALADEIKVVLVDGRSFDAKVIVKDPDCDLAALRFIKTSKNAHMFKKKFPKIEMGRGDECEVGDVCLAIGNNLGLQGTVTQGIISAVGRFMKKELPAKIVAPLIQTSASINPGSSGGALVNMDGKLIGINTAIVTPSGGNVGLAFAVPANYITAVLAAVDLKEEKIRRPFIGITLGKPEWPNKGIRVHGIMRNGPAEKAGIKAKDILAKFNGNEIRDSDRFLMQIALQSIGSKIKLTVKRGGESLDYDLEVGEWKPPSEKLMVIKDEGNPLEGCTLGEMAPSLNAKFGIEANKTGVIVVKVARGSSASGLFLPGDHIRNIGEVMIRTLEDISKAIDKIHASKPSMIKIRVARRAVLIEFRVRIGQRSKL